MKKLFLILLCAMLSSVYVFAQTSSPTEEGTADSLSTEGDEVLIAEKGAWKDNWFIGGGVGTSVFLGSADRRGPLSNRFGLNYDLTVGKWMTPAVGLQLQYTGGQARGHIAEKYANSTAFGDAFMGTAGYNVYKQKWNYHYVHADLMLNLSNLIGGYKEDRVYSFVTYVGVGVIHSPSGINNTLIAGNLGINNIFRVSPAFDITVDLKAIMVGNKFDTEVGDDYDKAMNGMITGSIGFAYKFNPRGFRTSSELKAAQKATDDELRRVSNELAQANKDKEDLKNQLDAEKAKEPQIVEKVTEELVLGGCVLEFEIGSSKLSKISKVNLGYIAEAINKMSADKVFTIMGYADKQTGSARRNQTVSKNRADAVYNALVNEFGVDKSKLKVEYKGGVANMFYEDPALSRVVIIE